MKQIFTRFKNFTLSVLEVNNNPQISEGSSISFTHTEDLVWDGSSLISATDQDGQFLEWTILVPPSHGDLNVSGVGYSPPVLSYLPDGNYTGADSFEILVSDGIGLTVFKFNLRFIMLMIHQHLLSFHPIKAL